MKQKEEEDWSGTNDGFLIKSPDTFKNPPAWAHYIRVLEYAAEQYCFTRKERLSMLHEVDNLKLLRQSRKR